MPKNFSVILAGNQEVPPNASTASGTGIVVWDTTTDTANYAFTFRGLDLGPALGLPPQTATTADDVTQMHFHNGARGVNAPVAFGQIGPAQDADDLGVVFGGVLGAPNTDGSWTVLGAWETTDPANTSIAAFAAALDSTPVGSDAPLYWDVHTTTFPTGAIRGQLVAASDLNITTPAPAPAPAPAATPTTPTTAMMMTADARHVDGPTTPEPTTPDATPPTQTDLVFF